MAKDRYERVANRLDLTFISNQLQYAPLKLEAVIFYAFICSLIKR